MGIVFTESFDGYGASPTAAQIGRRYAVDPGSPPALSSGRTGLALEPLVNSASVYIASLPTARPRMIIGFGYKCAASNTVMGLQFREGAYIHTHGYLSASGKITLCLSPGSTPLITGATSVNDNVWHYVEIDITVHDTAGAISLWVDGKSDATPVTNVDTRNSGTVGTIDSIAFGRAGSSATYWDDMVIIDPNDGTAPTQRIGPVRVAYLAPTGPGSEDGFAPQGAATTWEAVDEAPANDATDYASAASIGARSLFAMSNLPGGMAGVCKGVVGVFDTMTNGSVKTVGHSIKVGTSVIDSTLNAQNTPNWKIRQSCLWQPGGRDLTLAEVDAMEAGPLVVA